MPDAFMCGISLESGTITCCWGARNKKNSISWTLRNLPKIPFKPEQLRKSITQTSAELRNKTSYWAASHLIKFYSQDNIQQQLWEAIWLFWLYRSYFKGFSYLFCPQVKQDLKYISEIKGISETLINLLMSSIRVLQKHQLTVVNSYNRLKQGLLQDEEYVNRMQPLAWARST